MTTRSQLSAFILADGHIFHNFVELLFIDAGSHVRGGIESVAYAKRLDAFGKPLQKLFIKFLVYGHAAGRGTTLSGGAKTTPHRTFDGQIEMGIFHHDQDILPAHLQMTGAQLWRARLAH